VYITGRFVSKPNNRSAITKAEQKLRSTNRAVDTVTTPSELGSAPEDQREAANKLAASLIHRPEPDGAVLHAVAVSLLCFKIGRITIPPPVLFALEGFSPSPPPSADGSKPAPYSVDNPPPIFAEKAQPLRRNKKELAKFLRGGWRDVPEGERWWEDALGPLEEERIARLKALDGLRTSMEALRQMVE
jgi:hypothetical protein